MNTNELNAKIESGFKNHVLLVISVFVFIACFAAGTMSSSLERSKYNASTRKLADVENEIERVRIDRETGSQAQYVTKQAVGAVSVQRWTVDDNTILDFISDAFTFSSLDEYAEHRNKYVKLLGQADDFVLNIMPPTDPIFGGNASKNVNCRIDSFTSYIDSFTKDEDGDDDRYSYVGIITTATNSGKVGANSTVYADVIITYETTAKGDILDFHAFMPYDDGM